MKDNDKTQKQLTKELTQLRQRIAELKQSEIERKLAKEARRESEEELRSIFDGVRDGIVLLDMTGKIIKINKRITEVTGYTEEDIVGKRFKSLKIFTPKSITKMIFSFSKTLTGQKRLPYEVEGYTKTGEKRVAEIHASLLRKRRKAVGVITVMRDITERKRAEEAQAKAKRALTVLSECNQALVHVRKEQDLLREICRIIVEEGGYRLAWVGFAEQDKNKTVRPVAQTGYEKGSLATVNITWANTERGRGPTGKAIRMGKPSICKNIMTDPDYTPWRAEAKKCGYASSISLPLIDHGRSFGALNINAEEPDAFDQEEVSLLAKLANDLSYGIMALRTRTEREQAEKALQSAYDKLKESETRYRTLVENIDLGINLIDANHTILMASAAEGKQINKPLNDLIGKKCFREFEKRDAVCPHCPGVRAMATGQPAEAETEGVRDDGSRYNVRVQAFPVFGDDGTVTGFIEIAENITERKRTEKELRESEERYRSLFENSEDAILLTAPDGSIFKANPAACRMFGCTEAEITQMGRNGVVDQTDPRLPLALEERKRTGTFRGELTLVRSDGQPFPAEVTSVVFQSQDGQPRSSMLIRDITERKRAEEALRESEERFRTVFESAEDIIFIKDRDHRFTFVNPAMARDHGVPASKLIGKTSKDLFGEERSAKIIEDDLRVLRGEIINKEQPSPLKGSLAVHHLIKVPIHNSAGEIIGLCGIARDITERKQAEEVLRESESRYRTLFDSASDAIFILDPATGRFIDVNQTACERLGYSREELVQKTPLDIDSPEYAPLVRERIETLRQRGHLFFETAHVRRDGTTIPTETSSRIITYAGNPAVLSIARDVTRRKQAEEEIKRGYEQLQDTLLATVNALAATVEMKDQYTAGHQPRATLLACAIAEEMGLSAGQIEGIRIAASIHDIGKIVVPAEILNKPGPLSDIQYEMVKMHPRAGFDVLKGIKFPWPVAQIVLQHHELMDGSGYPQGLSGDVIMLEARILTVANVVEAMNAHRPYRAAHSIEKALEEVSQNRGKLYDPTVADACLKLFTEKRFTFD